LDYVGLFSCNAQPICATFVNYAQTMLACFGLCWLCNAHYMSFYFVMTIAQTICASFVMTIAQLYVLLFISLSIMNYLLICLDVFAQDFVSIFCQIV
jgi:hypothetical protein